MGRACPSQTLLIKLLKEVLSAFDGKKELTFKNEGQLNVFCRFIPKFETL